MERFPEHGDAALARFTTDEHDWVKWFIPGSVSCASAREHFNDDMNGAMGFMAIGLCSYRMYTRWSGWHG